ncbi:MAG: enoyl-CoA hydratase/isomerase family protein [Propionibacteriaceae bacterium]|nr:enoyl-CoA hydratase/isomerase family protein [Propionibacteriaceae bacterium]
MDEPVYLSKSGQIAVITLNQPAKKNAISAAMMDILVDTLRRCDVDDEVRVIILRGEGENFSAGGDLDQKVPGADTVEGKCAILQHYLWAVQALREVGKPVIAMADGYVVGGAFSLLLACDLVVVSDRVKVVPAFISIGIIPEMGLMKLLPAAVGEKLAKEILFLNKRLGSEDLLRLGIANRVFPANELAARTEDFARELAAQPNLSIQLSKRIMNAASDVGLDQVMRAEATSSPLCSLSAEFAEVARRFAK